MPKPPLIPGSELPSYIHAALPGRLTHVTIWSDCSFFQAVRRTKLNQKKAALLLYGLQIATINLRQLRLAPAADWQISDDRSAAKQSQ